MKIRIEIKSVYGNERIYPLDHIDELGVLTGQKTLSREHIEALKKLGFTFEIVGPAL